jgi:hypothetical protein
MFSEISIKMKDISVIVIPKDIINYTKYWLHRHSTGLMEILLQRSCHMWSDRQEQCKIYFKIKMMNAFCKSMVTQLFEIDSI